MDPVIFSRPVDGALWCIDRGLKVFPCKPNDKKPAFPGWQSWAETASRQKVEDYGRANPTNNWAVYCGASNIAVIDIDNKGAVKGSQTLTALIEKYGKIPETLTVATPSGGFHKYYVGNIKSTVAALGPGIDTRSLGGYVVAPGSRIDDKTYELFPEKIEPLPAWVATAIPEVPPVVLQENELVETGDRNKILTSMAGTMRARGMNYDTILAALLTFNETQTEHPLPEHEVEVIARSVAKYAPAQAKAASDFLEPTKLSAVRGNEIPAEESIKPRDWIMQDRYLGGFVTVIVSPGGVGKSTITMLDAVAIQSGQPLTGFEIRRQCPVWIYNTEDPHDELYRRMHAIAKQYKIPREDLANVHITSGQDHPFILAKTDSSGIVINQEAVEATIAYIKEHKIGVLFVDPFVKAHECDENNNMEMDKVVGIFSRIAHRTGAAICLVHHANKAGSNPNKEAGDMNISRGASAIVNAARIAHTIAPMNGDEATKFGISEDKRRWYLRMDNAKANMQPPAAYANWYERLNVILLNGDAVGTIRKAELVDIRAEKKKEAKQQDQFDLAKALFNVMAINEVESVKNMHWKLLSDPRAAFVFESVQNDRRAEEFIVGLIGTGIAYEHKVFRILVQPNKKPKRWIECAGVDPDLDIFK